MSTRFFLGRSNNLLVVNSKFNATIAREWKTKYKILKIKIDISYNSMIHVIVHK